MHRGALKKYYGGLLTRLPIEGRETAWVVINIHLSAFDRDPAQKARQLDALFAQAGVWAAAGDAVVIGGDWNMQIDPAAFPHDPALRDPQWTYDFPRDRIPEGWQVATDPAVPTVRSMQQPWRRGENHLMVIDGFVVSPNVEVLSVTGRDLDFAHTDHHPVTLRARLRD